MTSNQPHFIVVNSVNCPPGGTVYLCLNRQFSASHLPLAKFIMIGV